MCEPSSYDFLTSKSLQANINYQEEMISPISATDPASENKLVLWRFTSYSNFFMNVFPDEFFFSPNFILILFETLKFNELLTFPVF